MFAIDTNLLVYAHNRDSEFNGKATAFLEKVLNERDEEGNLDVCIPAQVLTEFVNVVTRRNIQSPLSLPEAVTVIRDYLDTSVEVINHKKSQIHTFSDLLISVTTRRKIFDVALAATLKDHAIVGIYTVNVSDFEEFDFLQVINPLK